MNAGMRYGGLGLPLAFVALPLYVSLPAFYAAEHGLQLGALGLLLLLSRGLDALIDPWIGRAADDWLIHSRRFLFGVLATAALVLAGSFWALFHPQVRGETALLLWCGLLLPACYLAYSVLSITHQAWGARLGGSGLEQARLNAWREGLGLAGVLSASLLFSLAGPSASAAALALALLAALWLLGGAPRELRRLAPSVALSLPWRTPGFRRLLGLFMLNGIAAAVPATLLLFFVRDRLQTPEAESLYLGSYFLAAACSMPLWLRAVARWGLARSWLAGMGLALLSFAWAALLPAGATPGFVFVCVGSGLALGADLSIPGAMLTRLIQQAGLAQRAEGAFYGWWNLVSKLNLAIAAGLALPLLQALGYAPGERGAQAQLALVWAYCGLPCLLKLGAASLLYRGWMRRPVSRSAWEKAL